MGSEHTGGNSYEELLPSKPLFKCRRGCEGVAQAKITGKSIMLVFLNSCPAFQDLEQGWIAVPFQFVLSILPSRGILASLLANEIISFLKELSYG